MTCKSLAPLSTYLLICPGKQFIFCKALRSPMFQLRKWQGTLSCQRDYKVYTALSSLCFDLRSYLSEHESFFNLAMGKRLKYQHFSSQNQSASLVSVSPPSLNPLLCWESYRCLQNPGSPELPHLWKAWGMKAKSYIKMGYFPLFTDQKLDPDHKILPTSAHGLLQESRTCLCVDMWINEGTGQGGRVSIKLPSTAEPALPAEC